jgi:dTDP-4-dehydrorhamnose 3,5-epimerase
MAGVRVNPLDPDAAIAWPLPVDGSNPAQISAKDASAPGLGTDASR